MAEQPQTIVEAALATDRAMGARKESNLRSSYPASPIYSGDVTDAERKKLFQETALDGVVLGGLGVNSYDRDFKGTTQDPVPSLEDVATGGGGLPATPYIPNLTSPGPGSVSATDQPEFNGILPTPENNLEFGSGLPGTTSPDETSERIAEQSLGNYISGKSYLGSNGQS
jgi:hypothetical protein